MLPVDYSEIKVEEEQGRMPLFADLAAWKRMNKILDSWVGTPYQHCTMVKGRGADCTLFLGACWKEMGILRDVTWEYYSKDWHLHTYEEKVLNSLYEHFASQAQRGYEIWRNEPGVELMRGDLLAFSLTDTGVSNHAAMFLGNTDRGPLMIHAAQQRGVTTFPLKGYFERHLTGVFRIMTWAIGTKT